MVSGSAAFVEVKPRSIRDVSSPLMGEDEGGGEGLIGIPACFSEDTRPNAPGATTYTRCMMADVKAWPRRVSCFLLFALSAKSKNSESCAVIAIILMP
jgi:hypothetical protein